MKNNAREFLDAISENQEIREYLEKYQIPEGMEKEACLAAVAEKFGYTVTKEELAEAFRCKQEELNAAVNDAKEAVQEISVNELDSVAGGGEVAAANANISKNKKEHDECQFTYQDKENCWLTDACDNYWVGYIYYICHISDRYS